MSFTQHPDNLRESKPDALAERVGLGWAEAGWSGVALAGGDGVEVVEDKEQCFEEVKKLGPIG